MFVVVGSFALPSFAQFERVPVLEPNVRFWQKVYAVWSVNQIAFHDRDDLSLVYRVVKVPARGKSEGGKNRSQSISAADAETKAALARLAKKNPKSCAGLEGVDAEICNSLKDVTRADKYSRTSLVRAQNGLYERSRKGWSEFGRYEPDVRRELKKAGLPEELIALAFLESLFNIRAESKSHAVGMWQFLKSTARDYMHVNHVLDERIDPVIATESATRYILQSRKKLGPWPLAITSYNIGRGGMSSGVKATGSTDLGVIVQKYKKGSFGFAAKNYYASFLALQDVVKNPNKYFPGVGREPAWRYDVVRLPFDATVTQLAKVGAVDMDTIVYFNPALTRDAREGRAVLPRGFSLRIAKGKTAAFLESSSKISTKERQKTQLHVRAWHRANGRQSVSTIARRYGADADVVAAMAGLKLDDTPAKDTKVPIPSSSVGFTLLPEARGMAVPGAPSVPAIVASKIEPPPDDTPTVRVTPRPPKNRPRVKVVDLRTVPPPEPSSTDEAIEVDVVAGTPVEAGS